MKPRLFLRPLVAWWIAPLAIGLWSVVTVGAAPIKVAVPAVAPHRPDRSEFAVGANAGGPLAERVQFALQAAPPLPELEFVERVSLDKILAEQLLEMAGESNLVPAIRTGRLSHADWALRLRFQTEDPSRPLLMAEVIDTLRADLLARTEQVLDGLPGASFYLQPSEAEVRLAAQLSDRALRAAEARARALAGLPRVAPLIFLNQSRQERLAPLGVLLQSALRRPRPAVHVLGYDADGIALGESALFLTGLSDLDAEAWARVADAFVWGSFGEEPDHAGPVADTPVWVRMQVWSDDRGPRDVSMTGRFGDLPALAEAAANAALSLVGETRITAPHAQRRIVADQITATARALHAQARAESHGSEMRINPLSPVRLVRMALFFDPLNESARTFARGFVPEDRPWPVHDSDLLALKDALDSARPAKSLPARAGDIPAEPAGDTPSKTPPQAVTIDHDPVFGIPLHRADPELVAAADGGPIIASPWLEGDWTSLAPAELVPAEIAANRYRTFRPGPLALAGGSLWLDPMFPASGAGELGTSGVWRVGRSGNLSGEARALEGFPDARVTAFALAPDGRFWFSANQRGVLGFDPGSETIFASVGVGDGLPMSEDNFLFPGGDGLLVGNWRRPEDRVVLISWDGTRVTQVSPPPKTFFPGLSAATRAAIASFPDDVAPKVKLPGTPAYGYGIRPVPTPPRSGSPEDPRQRRHSPIGLDERHAIAGIPTGPGDGYWVASLRSVAWASGSRRVPLAHWLQGEIRSLCDDGHHLCVAVSNHEQSSGASPTASPGVTLHFYDYHAGVWRGRMASSQHAILFGGDGKLLRMPTSLHTDWALCDTRSLRVIPAPAAPASASLPSSSAPVVQPFGPEWKKEHEKRRIQERLSLAVMNAAIDPDAVHSALAAGASPAGPCLLAAQNGHWDAVELLLPRLTAAELNTRSSTHSPTRLGLELIEIFLSAKRPELARRVTEAGADLAFATRGAMRKNLAWDAITTGETDLVIRFHQAGWPLSTGNPEHPLCEAARQKNEPLLRYLAGVSTKQEINSGDGHGLTALFVASAAGWTEGVRTLLDAGADDFRGDLVRDRSLRDAAAPWPEVAVLLNRRPGSQDNALDGARAVSAAIGGAPETLASLAITPGVLRYRDYYDWTVLHHAARHGRADFVARLLTAGADPDKPTSDGESALHLAVASLDAQSVFVLLRADADPKLRSAEGWTPLHIAAGRGRADLVRALLGAGADPSVSAGEDSLLPLLLAAKSRDDEESVRLLIAAGASAGARDRLGYGPLEYAVLSDSPEKIQYLLDHGARWAKRFDNDYHPMDVAARNGLTRSIRKLRSLGLQSPRALSFAADATTRALLESDESEAGRLRRLNEDHWPVVLAEPDGERLRERVAELLAAGADPNHLSHKWGTPLGVALAKDDPDFVRWFVARGARGASRTLLVWSDGYRRPGGALLGWFHRQEPIIRSGGSPATQDEVAVAYLELLWEHDDTPGAQEEMLHTAENIGLTRAAAWIRSRPLHLKQIPPLP